MGYKNRVTAAFLAMILMIFSVITVSSDNTNDKVLPFRYYDNKTFSEFAEIDFPEPEGKFAFAVNLETGSVMYEKNADILLFPASTVKLMTALVVFENISDLDMVIYASEEAVKKTTGTRLNPTKPIKAGEGLTARELLYGLLVTGANDAANVLAEHVGGSIEGFCDMMNEKAKSIGANNTTFKNPTGLHHPEMKTTARDMALISCHAYYVNELVKMAGTTNYTIEETNKTSSRRYLYNRNRMIRRVEGEKSYFYKGALGLSAGSTPEGGNCVVAAAQKGGLTYLTVVMDSPDTENENFAYEDSVALLNACFDGFSVQTVVGGGKMMCEIPVSLAANVDHVTLYAKDDITALLPNNIDFENEIDLKRLVYEDAEAPVNEGQSFGELAVTYKGTITLGKTDLVASTSVDRSNLLYILNRLAKFFTSSWFVTALISAVVLFAIYCVVYYKTYRRRGFRK